jgi:hypothetical protein
MKKLALCVCAGLLVSACATDPASTAEPMTDKVYRTGSNIPAREASGVVTVSPESVERQRDQSTGNVGKRPGMGS